MTILPVSQVRLWSMLVISVPVVIEDLRARRIPNWACGVLLCAGLGAGLIEDGARGLLISLAGALAGFAVFLIFYAAGGMGAGDIKLMAACGSLVGVRGLFVTAALTSVAGAAIAIAAIIRGRLRRRRAETIPYGPAIVAGALLTLVARAV